MCWWGIPAIIGEIVSVAIILHTFKKKNKKLNDVNSISAYTTIDINRLEDLSAIPTSYHQILESELSIYAIVNGRKFYCKDTGNFYYDYKNKRYELNLDKYGSDAKNKFIKGQMDIDYLIERDKNRKDSYDSLNIKLYDPDYMYKIDI
jgi:hypothetical protein